MIELTLCLVLTLPAVCGIIHSVRERKNQGIRD